MTRTQHLATLIRQSPGNERLRGYEVEDGGHTLPQNMLAKPVDLQALLVALNTEQLRTMYSPENGIVIEEYTKTEIIGHRIPISLTTPFPQWLEENPEAVEKLISILD